MSGSDETVFDIGTQVFGRPETDTSGKTGGLLDLLRDAGLKIGPRERMSAGALLADLLPRLPPDTTLADLRAVLAPLLARSPQERERFFAIFDSATALRTASQPEPSAREPIAEPVAEPQGRWRSLRSWFLADRRRLAIPVAAALLIAAVAALLFWQPSRPVAPTRLSNDRTIDTGPTALVNQGSAATPLATTPAAVVAPDDVEQAVRRIVGLARPYYGVPTLDELAHALARKSPIGWSADAYAVRLQEMTGLPRYQPLVLVNIDDASVAAANSERVLLRISVQVALGMSLFIGQRDAAGALKDISIRDGRNNKFSVTYTALRGQLTRTPQGQRMTLFDGTVIQVSNATAQRSILKFERYVMDTKVLAQLALEPQVLPFRDGSGQLHYRVSEWLSDTSPNWYDTAPNSTALRHVRGVPVSGLLAGLSYAVAAIEEPGRQGSLADYAKAEINPIYALEPLAADRTAGLQVSGLVAENLAAQLSLRLPANQAIPGDESAAIAFAQRLLGVPLAPAAALQRAFAASNDPRIHRIFSDAPWLKRAPASGAQWSPWWTPWIVPLLPLAMAALWLFNSFSRRKAFLRRRAPIFPPLHTDLLADAVARLKSAGAHFQRIGQRLQRRSPRRSDRLDIKATVGATIAQGGELVVPRFLSMRAAAEYLVLIERRGAADQDYERLRAMILDLKDMLALDIYSYQSEPSMLEPDGGGSAVSIERLISAFPHHRLLVLGSGAEFLDPVERKPVYGAAALMSWERRALLTPVPLAEWAREEFLLARELALPIGRATPDGLLALADMLRLDGTDGDDLLDVSGDGRAQPLPGALRIRPERYLYSVPPEDHAPERIIMDLRNYLDAGGFDWLCALAVYPATQWDLTLFLGTSLPLTAGRSSGEEPLYDERRLSALTQLPWLRESRMPDWLRLALIQAMPKERADEVRGTLRKLLEAARESGDTAKDESIRIRIAREPSRERIEPDQLYDDEVLLDFMARGRVEDFEFPNSSFLDRVLPDGWLRRFGWPEFGIGIVGLSYVAAAIVLSPDWRGGALVTNAWLPLLTLAAGLILIAATASLPPVIRAARATLAWLAPVGLAIATTLIIKNIGTYLGLGLDLYGQRELLVAALAVIASQRAAVRLNLYAYRMGWQLVARVLCQTLIAYVVLNSVGAELVGLLPIGLYPPAGAVVLIFAGVVLFTVGALVADETELTLQRVLARIAPFGLTLAAFVTILAWQYGNGQRGISTVLEEVARLTSTVVADVSRGQNPWMGRLAMDLLSFRLIQIVLAPIMLQPLAWFACWLLGVRDRRSTKAWWLVPSLLLDVFFFYFTIAACAGFILAQVLQLERSAPISEKFVIDNLAWILNTLTASGLALFGLAAIATYVPRRWPDLVRARAGDALRRLQPGLRWSTALLAALALVPIAVATGVARDLASSRAIVSRGDASGGEGAILATSPDGAFFATGGADGVVRVFAASDPTRPQSTIDTQAGPISALAIRKQKSGVLWVMVGAVGATVKLYDGARGPLATLIADTKASDATGVPAIALGEGSWAVAVEDAAGASRIVTDRGTGPALEAPAPVTALAAARDHWFAYGMLDGSLGHFRIESGGKYSELRDMSLRLPDATPTLGFHDPDEEMHAVAFTADGRRLLAVSSYVQDGTLRVWDAFTGKALGSTEIQPKLTFDSTLISADGSRILNYSEQAPAALIDAATGKQLAVLAGSNGRILSAVFTPDGTQIVAVTDDATVRIWDAGTGKVIMAVAYPSMKDDLYGAVVSPSGKKVLWTFGARPSQMWDISSGAHFVLAGPPLAASSVAFAPDETWFVAVTGRGDAGVFDIHTGRLLGSLAIPLERARSDTGQIAISPDGYSILVSRPNTGGGYDALRIFDVRTRALRAILPMPHTMVGKLLFSPDGKFVLTRDEAGDISLWNIDLHVGIRSLTVDEKTDDVTAIALDGSVIRGPGVGNRQVVGSQRVVGTLRVIERDQRLALGPPVSWQPSDTSVLQLVGRLLQTVVSAPPAR